MIKKLLTAWSFLCLSSLSYSGQSSGWGIIEKVSMRTDGSLMTITFSHPVVNPDSCGGGSLGNSKLYMLEVTDRNKYSTFISTVMAAHVAKQEVAFWIGGCTKNKYWGLTRPTVFDIQMRQ